MTNLGQKEIYSDLPLFLGCPGAWSIRSNYPPDMDQTESFCEYSADFNSKVCGKFGISTFDGSLDTIEMSFRLFGHSIHQKFPGKPV